MYNVTEFVNIPYYAYNFFENITDDFINSRNIFIIDKTFTEKYSNAPFIVNRHQCCVLVNLLGNIFGNLGDKTFLKCKIESLCFRNHLRS